MTSPTSPARPRDLSGDKRALLLLPLSGPPFPQNGGMGAGEGQSGASSALSQPCAFLERQLCPGSWVECQEPSGNQRGKT